MKGDWHDTLQSYNDGAFDSWASDLIETFGRMTDQAAKQTWDEMDADERDMIDRALADAGPELLARLDHLESMTSRKAA